MAVSAKLGIWVLEQPGSSVLEFYPAFRHLMTYHYNFFGPAGAAGSVKRLKSQRKSEIVARR